MNELIYAYLPIPCFKFTCIVPLVEWYPCSKQILLNQSTRVPGMYVVTESGCKGWKRERERMHWQGFTGRRVAKRILPIGP